jgi:hypothetical protein
MKVTQIRDQLATIGDKVANAELLNMALNGFPTSWEPFVKGIYGVIHQSCTMVNFR